MNSQMTPINLLLVDDEMALLRGISRGLSELTTAQFNIHTAICAAEAEVIMNRNPIDVVVSDYQMVGTNGMEFLEKIKTNRPQTSLILLSGHVAGVPVIGSWAEEIGIDRVLSKPCDCETLAKAIVDAVEFNSPLSET